MRTERFRRLVAALAIGLIAAFALVACGGDGGTTAIETEGAGTTAPEATTEAGETTAADETTESGGEPLAKIAAPTPSTLLDRKESGGVVYERYETSLEPKRVEADYNRELTAAGWSIENSGGSGGGWGPYGGSDYGLTAKREDEYLDVQAGGEKGGTAYFEVCAGEGTRDECDDLSEGSHDTDSGGSGGDDSESETESGGS